MTTTELRELLVNSKSYEIFNEIDIEILFQYGQDQIILKGVASIYEFVEKQLDGWGNLGEFVDKDFNQSIGYFANLKNRLATFIQNYHESDSISIENAWNQEINHFTRTSEVFLFDAPITLFLIEVHDNLPVSFNASKRFFTGSNHFIKYN